MVEFRGFHGETWFCAREQLFSWLTLSKETNCGRSIVALPCGRGDGLREVYFPQAALRCPLVHSPKRMAGEQLHV